MAKHEMMMTHVLIRTGEYVVTVTCACGRPEEAPFRQVVIDAPPDFLKAHELYHEHVAPKPRVRKDRNPVQNPRPRGDVSAPAYPWLRRWERSSGVLPSTEMAIGRAAAWIVDHSSSPGITLVQILHGRSLLSRHLRSALVAVAMSAGEEVTWANLARLLDVHRSIVEDAVARASGFFETVPGLSEFAERAALESGIVGMPPLPHVAPPAPANPTTWLRSLSSPRPNAPLPPEVVAMIVAIERRVIGEIWGWRGSPDSRIFDFEARSVTPYRSVLVAVALLLPNTTYKNVGEVLGTGHVSVKQAAVRAEMVFAARPDLRQMAERIAAELGLQLP
jgi:hypothetical protein